LGRRNRHGIKHSMKAALLLILAGWTAQVCAEEVWQQVFTDESQVVSVDAASFFRQKQRVVFRERHVLLPPQTDPASLRKIVEVQYRRAVDCAARRLAVLSRAAFSENNALVHYEAVQAGKAGWTVPRSTLENNLLVRACGAA